jgi:polyphosphate kinase 2 (PPK2 family)
MLEIIDLSQALDKESYRREVDRYQTWMRMLGYHLYYEKRPAVIVFEGWDAAGKGGAINRLTERLDPREFVVHPIGAPRGDDAEKHYLWRFWRRLPERGNIAIFDRSWYGRVMVERVEGLSTPVEWQRAYREIKDFEAQLVGFGTIVIKFWLHISKEEQLRRFQDRQTEPNKAWKLTDEDWRNREKWDQYEAAVEEMLIRTTTATAPWTITPANDKYFARVQVLKTVVERFARELHVDLSADALVSLPLGAAPTPIPEWAKVEARQYGIKDV